MANKRLRKKQKAKKNINLLNKIGVTDKKVIKELKNDSQKITALQKKEQRRNTANERSAIIKSFGYKVSDHSPKRYWSENRWNEWVSNERKKQQRASRKKDNANEKFLLIFWRDKTAEGFADTELIERYKYQYRYMDNEQLLSRINHYLRTPKAQGAEIGTTHCALVNGSQLNQYINFMSHISNTSMKMADVNDWVLVYKGKAKRYHDLLLAIHAVIRLLYDASERADFINTLIDRHLPLINKNMARRLAKDLGWRGF